MNIYPAIDIYKGQAVRLLKGAFDQMTSYGNPKEILKKWQAAGGTYCHIVDLNGAKNEGDNSALIIEMIKSSELKIQVGGGIRSLEKAEAYLQAGANKIILGTSVIKDETLLKELLEAYPDKIAVALDVRNEEVSLEGWLEKSGVLAVDLLNDLENTPLKTLIYTDILKDGTMTGPNFLAYESLVKSTNFDIVASGGVTSLDDIKRLKALGVKGVILGKTLYEKKITLEEALKC